MRWSLLSVAIALVVLITACGGGEAKATPAATARALSESTLQAVVHAAASQLLARDYTEQFISLTDLRKQCPQMGSAVPEFCDPSAVSIIATYVPKDFAREGVYALIVTAWPDFKAAKKNFERAVTQTSELTVGRLREFTPGNVSVQLTPGPRCRKAAGATESDACAWTQLRAPRVGDDVAELQRPDSMGGNQRSLYFRIGSVQVSMNGLPTLLNAATPSPEQPALDDATWRGLDDFASFVDAQIRQALK